MVAKLQRIQRIGNSSGILLPKEWLRARGLRPGAKVRVEISEARVVVLPQAKDREVKADARFARQVDAFLKKNRKIIERLS